MRHDIPDKTSKTGASETPNLPKKSIEKRGDSFVISFAASDESLWGKSDVPFRRHI